MKQAINNFLGIFGLKLIRITFKKPVHTVTQTDLRKVQQTMDAALYRMAERGLNPITIIDIGASNGCWSEKCMHYFPNANYFLVDAQSPHKPDLDKFKMAHSNVQYIISAAGERKGEIYFDTSELFTGIASEKPFTQNNTVVPVNSIDNWIKEYNLTPPYVIKLDTHGFEVPIINGASKALKNTELLIIEVYNYRLQEDTLRFYELCQFMDNLGFLPLEAVDLMQRKKDYTFWQMDIFFVPKSYKNLDYVKYE